MDAVLALASRLKDRSRLFEASDDALEYVRNLSRGYVPCDEAAAYWRREAAMTSRASPLDKCLDRRLLVIYLKKRFGYRSYLEIGCRSDQLFSSVPFRDKVGVDPASGGTVRATSDQYFATCARSFDLIFIDGLHEAGQLVNDVQNALRVLRQDGTIVVHDAKPLFPAEATFPMPSNALFWNGTVWKGIAYLRTFTDIDVIVADFDWGLALIRVKANTAPLVLPRPYLDLTWADYTERWVQFLRPHDMDAVDRWCAAPSDQPQPCTLAPYPPTPLGGGPLMPHLRHPSCFFNHSLPFVGGPPARRPPLAPFPSPLVYPSLGLAAPPPLLRPIVVPPPTFYPPHPQVFLHRPHTPFTNQPPGNTPLLLGGSEIPHAEYPK